MKTSSKIIRIEVKVNANNENFDRFTTFSIFIPICCTFGRMCSVWFELRIKCVGVVCGRHTQFAQNGIRKCARVDCIK